ncbi:methyltransferase FkbM family [Rippkaea orientalis PCC 8801]|uniref:Methyltransferase FkbM family n=1 Tax=Rippkaea orientalis (strain PCC 8801 / RF-1) TaxID=41431 RepID=B7JYC5_RIPO1|nr:FkbM family methyltransferase [Rippkaea orientalis]ACK67227.1 methyltransferase FkbM family [Rippkaea orientalis PCC 8801]
MNNFKEWLKIRLSRALAPEIDQQLGVNQKLEEVRLYGIAPWYQENFWEPTVQLALRDLCRPGDIVFDVGANFGGLTTVMSRMVGPRGVVCAFEASPRIVDKCQRNLVLSGCNNVQLFHAAVYYKSYSTVPIYLGSHLNDSIYTNSEQENAAYQVSTIALDDFVEHTGLVPNFVKMDIEGAEFDAIKGMTKTINSAKPHLILETQPDDTNCLDFLREAGYIAIDLNTYKVIETPQDYPQGVGIRNNLYIHRDRLSEVAYNPPFNFREVATVNTSDFQKKNDGSIALKTPLILDRGRYLIDVDFTAQGTNNDLTCGVSIGEKVIFRYHAYSNLLASSYRDWVIHLSETSKVSLYFNFLNGTSDETLSIKGAKITEITNFQDLPTNLYV